MRHSPDIYCAILQPAGFDRPLVFWRDSEDELRHGVVWTLSEVPRQLASLPAEHHFYPLQELPGVLAAGHMEKVWARFARLPRQESAPAKKELLHQWLRADSYAPTGFLVAMDRETTTIVCRYAPSDELEGCEVQSRWKDVAVCVSDDFGSPFDILTYSSFEGLDDSLNDACDIPTPYLGQVSYAIFTMACRFMCDTDYDGTLVAMRPSARIESDSSCAADTILQASFGRV